MSTDSDTSTATGLGWPEPEGSIQLGGVAGAVGWPAPAPPTHEPRERVSRETSPMDDDGTQPIDAAAESTDDSRETGPMADHAADTVDSRGQSADVPRETADDPGTLAGTRRPPAHARADEAAPAGAAPTEVHSATGSHRRFSDEQSAGGTDSPEPVEVGAASPNEPASSPEDAPRPIAVVRTAAEIAALPSVIGGVSAAHDLETPLAAATGMALRAQGIDRSSALPRPTQTRVMVVANQKGGVGKTTSAVNVAAALALYGSKVLLIDLDPQGNASTALGIEHHIGVPSMYEVLVRGTAISDVIQPAVGIANLSCAPATIDLSGAEVELVAMVAREQRLKRAIQAHLASPALQGDARYDYVLIDCPPSLGLLTINALAAGVEVFIPIQCEYYALEGVSQLVRIVDLVRTQLNPELVVTTVLLTMYDARTRLSAQVADEVRKHFGPVVLATAIPRSVRISEAPSYSQSVMTYDPGSTGALSYLEAAREIAHASHRVRRHEEVS